MIIQAWKPNMGSAIYQSKSSLYVTGELISIFVVSIKVVVTVSYLNNNICKFFYIQINGFSIILSLSVYTSYNLEIFSLWTDEYFQ